MASEAAETTREIIDIAKENFLPVAEAIKNISVDAFQIVARKVFWVNGVANFLLWLMITSIFVFCLVRCIKLWQEHGEDSSSKYAAQFAVCIVIGAITGLTTIGLTVGLIDTLGSIFIPEYYAVIEVVNLAK